MEGGDTENYNSPRPSSVESGQEGSEASGCWPVVRDCAERVARRSLRTGGGDVRGLRGELVDFVRQVFAPVARAMGGDPGEAWWWMGRTR